ncbi:MAG: bifunctional [glutamate--ammonia ligase]-adenylyl-L-tyrosine phosphorylase/[glutamate--ammonia-ligase] adenylyltransferase [Pseudomonadota bacterium]
MSALPVPPQARTLADSLIASLEARSEIPGGSDGDAVREQLAYLAATSDFCAQSLARTPGLLTELLAVDLLETRSLQGYQDRVAAALADTASRWDIAKRELRVLRRREMVRIAWRELLQLCVDEQETLSDLSHLAEACVSAAIDHCHRAAVARHGEPLDQRGERQQLIALGMGKLGGGELNFSSDIDLVFAYAESGKTTGRDDSGRGSLDNGQFFIKVAQRAIELLGDVTADGFVYRVDMRLRPFGASGPLVMNFDGLEAYYLTQGREWERYAMVKARPLCGRAADIELLEAMLKPFVYRRYLDYGALDALRELKHTMVAEMARSGRDSCIKLGVGGIREIEFVVQSFQLVRGGRDAALRHRALVPVLHYIGERGWLSQDDTAFLRAAYTFLRALENRLQMLDDKQVHALPSDASTQARIALAMGQPTWADLEMQLAPLRARVHALFRAVFALDAVESSQPSGHAFWRAGLTEAEVHDALLALGYDEARDLAHRLADLRNGIFYGRLSANGQTRLDRLIPKLVHQALHHDNAVATLNRSLAIVRAIAGRSAYLQVLQDNPPALALLLKLCSAGEAISDFIARHPIVIDELLSGDTLNAPIPRAELEAQAWQLLSDVDERDLETQMDRLRQLKHSIAMRVAIADVLGSLSVMRVSDQLTWLAEAVLTVASRCVLAPLAAQHGSPRCEVGGVEREAEIAIVAYGKLGGIELGYASDLDLVFVHNSTGKQQRTNGDKPVDNHYFFSRYVKKLTHFLSTATSAGTLYETDTRLRPDGQSGLMVSAIDAFERYQLENAWTWEHQALTRARVIGGSVALGEQFEAVRARILRDVGQREGVLSEVCQMRERMRSELSRGTDTVFDLKQDAGGIADIEFMVQYGVLIAAPGSPTLVRYTDNVRLLEQLPAAGWLSDDVAEALTEAYLYFRKLAHRLSLQGERALVCLSETGREHQSRVVAT